MPELLNDQVSLRILENLCNGAGVEVNISSLARDLKKHRDTVRSHVDALFENKIVNKPVYPFLWLFQEFPLMVVVRADLPKNEQINGFLKEDEHIFGAFYVKDEEFNTLIIQYFKDLTSYIEWRKSLTAEKRIPPRDTRYPASASYFSTKFIIKYQPHSPIYRLEEKQQNGEEIILNGYKLNQLSLQILKSLLIGNDIRTNENLLSKQIGVNRKTVERHISNLLKERIVGKPACRFPKFFVPPDHILVYYLIEIKKSYNNMIRAIKSDPCIPLAFEASIGRYNLLMFQVFANVDEHLDWEERYTSRFPDSLGAMKNIYLSPKMTASIDQQKISLGIIKAKMASARGKQLREYIH